MFVVFYLIYRTGAPVGLEWATLSHFNFHDGPVYNLIQKGKPFIIKLGRTMLNNKSKLDQVLSICMFDYIWTLCATKAYLLRSAFCNCYFCYNFSFYLGSFV